MKITFFGLAAIAIAFFSWQIAGMKHHGKPEPEKTAAAASAPPGTDWNDYLWPIEGCDKRTSNFAEFRDSHFHAGIDIATQQRTGWPVRASRSGWLHSARFEAGGYGVFLVLRHADGFYTTYAHLTKYAPKVQQAYERELLREGKSFGAAEWAPREIPVEKGEIIAYSGRSGAGRSPHLHFEVRDSSYAAVHPEHAPALRTADTIAPVIVAVAFTPLDASATINGRHDQIVLTAMRTPRGTYRVEGAPVLTGRVGLLVRASDQAQNASDHASPFRIACEIDGAPFFTSTADCVPAAMGWHIRIDRDNDLMRAAKGEFRKLYREEGNRLPFYQPNSPDAGTLSAAKLGAGKKTIRITASDISGNTAELQCAVTLAQPPMPRVAIESGAVVIRIADPGSAAVVRVSTVTREGRWIQLASYEGAKITPQITWKPGGAMPAMIKVQSEDAARVLSAPVYVWSTPPAAAGTLDVNRKTFDDQLVYTIRSTAPFAKAPALVLKQGSATVQAEAVAETPSLYRAVLKVPAGGAGPIRVDVDALCGGARRHWSETINATLVTPDAGGSIRSADGVCTIDFAPGDVYKPMLAWVDATGDGRYAAYPQNVPLAGAPRVSFKTQPALAAHSVVRAVNPAIRIRIKQLPHAGLPANTAAAACANYLAAYALVHDPDPPAIAITESGRRAVVIRVTDPVSGPDAESLRVTLDGALLHADMDENTGLFTAHLPAGASGTIMVRVRDKAGNTGEARKALRGR